MQLTRSHSQLASKSRAKVFYLIQPQNADAIYKNLFTLVQKKLWKILDSS